MLTRTNGTSGYARNRRFSYEQLELREMMAADVTGPFRVVELQTTGNTDAPQCQVGPRSVDVTPVDAQIKNFKWQTNLDPGIKVEPVKNSGAAIRHEVPGGQSAGPVSQIFGS